MTAPAAPRKTKAMERREARALGLLTYESSPRLEREDFFCARPPRYDAELGPSPELAYYRKSSEDAEKQVRSIPQQRKEVERVAGHALPMQWHEAYSGTTFDGRPAFTGLLEFSKANPQPRARDGTLTGIIWAYDYDRFSREQLVIDGVPKPNAKAMVHMLLEFEKYGWRWVFIHSPSVGHELGDMFMGLVKFEQAGDESSKISRRVRSGKRTLALEEGYWVGGTPPWGTVRVDAVTGREYGPCEWVQEQHRVLLRGTPTLGEWWPVAARTYLDGESAEAVAALFTERDVPLGPTMDGWSRKNVLAMLTNPAYIGRPIFGAHTSEPRQYKAKWDPMVDLELFESVQAEVKRRSGPSATKVRGLPVPLRLTCPRCDAAFHMCHLPDGRRVYKHPSPTGPKAHDWRLLAKAKGCRCWVLDADDAEAEVMALIREQRLSPDYEALIRQEFDRQQRAAENTAGREHVAKAALDKARKDRERMSRQLEWLEDERQIREWSLKLSKADDEIERLHQRWQMLREATVQTDAGWDAIRARLDESEQLLRAFASGDLEKRRRLFCFWVECIDVHVTDLPTPASGRRQSRYKGSRKAKTLAVFLATNPERPESRVIPGRYGQLCADGGKSRNRGAPACRRALRA